MLWVVIQYHVIYFAAQILPAFAIGSYFRLALVSLNMSLPFFFKHFIALESPGAPGLHCIFTVPALELAISPEIPSSFYMRIISRNQDPGTNVQGATGE